MSSASIVGSGPKSAFCVGESSCASPTAGGGRWGPEGASEAVLGACLTNRLVVDYAVDKHRRVVEQAAALDLSWPPCTRCLVVSSTMAVVRVRAAIRLDGRRAHELRVPAAMTQANGGCDAVLPSRGRWDVVPPHSYVV
jgi:hypothetical protein